jgi:hypothetical protein
MCNPIAFVGGVASIAGGAAQSRAARRQAAQQAAYNRQAEAVGRINYERMVAYQAQLAEFQADQYTAMAVSSEQALGNVFGSILNRVKQVELATKQNVTKFSQQAASQMAFGKASAAESGVTGNSIALMADGYAKLEDEANTNSFANLEGEILQQQATMAGYRASYQSALNSKLPPPLAPVQLPTPQGQVTQPSSAPYILSGVAQAANFAIPFFKT